MQSRGGVGIINIQTSDRNGKVVGIAYVHDDDELLLITQQGMILRMQTDDIRTIGRATQGVRLIDIEEDDKVVSVAQLAEKEDEARRRRAADGQCRRQVGVPTASAIRHEHSACAHAGSSFANFASSFFWPTVLNRT